MEEPLLPCHPERTPDFLPRCFQKRSRMRLSLRKAARYSPKPPSLTGNPEEAEGPAVRSISNEMLLGKPSTSSSSSGEPALSEVEGDLQFPYSTPHCRPN